MHCLFTGKGYNDAFTANMEEVIKQITHQPNAPLELVNGADELCSCCPNLRADGSCQLGGDDVLQKDEVVLTALMLDDSTTYTYSEIIRRVSFLSELSFCNCCGTCKWQEMGCCSYTALKKV